MELNSVVNKHGMSLLTTEINLRGGSRVFSIHAKNWAENSVPHTARRQGRESSGASEREDRTRGEALFGPDQYNISRSNGRKK
jgi:hypothetical protein